MPRLIHLNGPSRVGKSTLARRYVDDHPGTLCLDIDVLVGLVGGWREDFSAACVVARAHGLALATRHLRGGHDVVVPQLVTVFDQDRRFEMAATDVGARYIEVALLVDIDDHARRLHEKEPASEVEAKIQSDLETGDLVERVRGHLAEYLEGDRARSRSTPPGYPSTRLMLGCWSCSAHEYPVNVGEAPHCHDLETPYPAPEDTRQVALRVASDRRMTIRKRDL